ncbi:MAG TPA: ferric reductase-like transmembrane domain-containing protein [Solirubrobacteraceae bacterium]
MHLTSSPIDWYAARAGGVVAYILLTIVVVLGTTMASGARSRRWPRFAVQDVHRFAGLLTGTFLVLHIVAIAIDSYLPFTLSSILVPFTSSYRPVFVGLGVVGAELLAALAITNRLRDRMPYETWRRLHYLNFAVWAGATVHGLGSGTDRSAPWLLAIEALCVFAVLSAIGWRILRARDAVRPPALGLVAGGAAVVSAVLVALALGPLAFHPRPWNAGTFSDSLEGQILSQNGTTRGIVSMAGRGTGTQRVLVRADLLVGVQQLIDTEFQMEYLPSGAACRGRVQRIDPGGLGFRARCRMADGRARSIHARWDAADGGVLSGGVIVSRALA